MKPKVFLASSTPAKSLMHQIAGWFEDWNLEPWCWDEVGRFRPGDFILERLLELSEEVDAAIILFGDEDKEWYRPQAQPQPRDNVLIEYGIFASRLGRERTVVCRRGRPKVASDLGGVISVEFGSQKASQSEARKRLKDWAGHLPELIRQARERDAEREKAADRPLTSGVDAVFTVPAAADREVHVVTGSLRDIRGVDVIVSSENTDLQPARYYDRSMSGTLRYLDAEKNPADLRVRRDAYIEALESAKRRDQVVLPVLPGAVLAAETTGLRGSGVKYVFHAAVVQGRVETGYEADDDGIREAIKNCFQRFTDIGATQPMQSILFPVFGAGAGGLLPDAAADGIVAGIEAGLRGHPAVTRVLLLAHVETHRRALHNAATAARWKPKI